MIRPTLILVAFLCSSSIAFALAGKEDSSSSLIREKRELFSAEMVGQPQVQQQQRSSPYLYDIENLLEQYKEVQANQENQQQPEPRRGWGNWGGSSSYNNRPSYGGGSNTRPTRRPRPTRRTRPTRRPRPTRAPQRPQQTQAPQRPQSGGGSSGGASGGSDCESAFQAAMQSQTNMYRNRHHARSLGNSDSSANRVSVAYAKQLNDAFKFEHNPQLGQLRLGENLYRKMSSRQFSTSASACAGYAKDAVDAWYDEISMYDFNRPGFSMATGHFTALVWKSTTQGGHGLAMSTRKNPSNGMYYVTVVSNYSPGGNVEGLFKSEVLAQ